jgi:hypothetical protein
MSGGTSGCGAYFSDQLQTPHGELKVYRCDWGWFVKGETREARSRYLDEAMEAVLGGPPDTETLRGMIDMLSRELTAERDVTGHTASRAVQV